MNDFEKIISELADMTDKDFVETVYSAIQKRPHTSDTKEGRGHFILSNTVFDVDDGIWESEVVGLHDPLHYSSGFVKDALLCQFGRCEKCDSSTISWAKNAICAVCEAGVYCT